VVCNGGRGLPRYIHGVCSERRCSPASVRVASPGVDEVLALLETPAQGDVGGSVWAGLDEGGRRDERGEIVASAGYGGGGDSVEGIGEGEYVWWSGGGGRVVHCGDYGAPRVEVCDCGAG